MLQKIFLPSKSSSSRSTSRASAACLNQELCCFSLLLWNSTFSICLAKFTRAYGGKTGNKLSNRSSLNVSLRHDAILDLTLIASMHLVSMGNMGRFSSFPRVL